jgi:diguanylate cyclase (GGDEF)-like protein/PAS domain S-box-containing protein
LAIPLMERLKKIKNFPIDPLNPIKDSYGLLNEEGFHLLSKLLGAVPLGIHLQTFQGIILFSNALLASMHGYTENEITSSGFSSDNFISLKDREKTRKTIQNILKSETISSLRFTGLRKDGSEFFEEVSAGLVKDPKGTPAAILVISRDISDQVNIFESEQRERALSEALIKSAALLSSTLHLDVVLEQILELVKLVVPHDSANVMLIKDGLVHVVRSRGYKSPELELFNTSILAKVQDMPSLVQMIQDGLPIMIPDTRLYPGWFAAEGFSWVLSYLGAPLRVKGKPIGVINLDSGEHNFFKEDDKYRLQAFADLAAKAIENARLYETLEQQASESAALFRASTALLNTSSDIDSMAEQIVQTVHQDFTTAHCAVLIVDEPNFLLYRIAQAGYPTTNTSPLNFKDVGGLAMKAIRKKNPIYVPDVTKDPEYFTGSDLTRSEFDIPFIVNNNVIGVLNMESSEIDGFNERARRVLISYAERAAIALENARLFKSLLKREFQISLLNQITQISLETSDLKEMLKFQATLLLETFSPDGVVFAFSNGDLRKITKGFASSFDMAIDKTLNKLVEDPIFSFQLAEFSNSIVTKDTTHANIKDPALHNPFRAYNLRTLSADGIHLGSVTIGFIDTRIFDPGELDFFEQAAKQIALAISKNLSVFIANERAREAESLREASATLTSTLKLQEILEKILVTAARAIPSAQKGLLFLLDPEKRSFLVRAQYGYEDKNIFSILLNEHEGLAGKAVTEKQALIIKDVRSEKNTILSNQNKEASEQNSWIVAPLIQLGKVFGVIELSAANTDVFSENDLKVLISFADTVTAAIQNAQLHAEVEQIAITDALTGLYNRRGFIELGEREMQRSIRTNAPLSILILDVDFLKQINDEYGHHAGDQVLQEIAECCRKTFRQIDLLARYGGDEFAVLLPDTPLDHATDAAKRLHQSISDQILSFEGKQIKLSASIGLAEFDKSLNSINDFFDRADKALYFAKNKGRNTIAYWDHGLSIELKQ